MPQFMVWGILLVQIVGKDSGWGIHIPRLRHTYNFSSSTGGVGIGVELVWRGNWVGNTYVGC